MSDRRAAYRDFLAEMKALEDFRASYHQRHPEAGLEREEPDVRRLIESMAYFSVRTRQVAERSIQATWQRLFSSYFEFLLTPLPAMAMVQAAVTLRRVEPSVLPRGAEVKLTAPSGVTASFVTQQELRILPIALQRTQVLQKAGGGYRLVLEFQSRFGRSDPVGLLRLYVRYLDDYATSLYIHYQLRAHLQRAAVVYDQTVDETSEGLPCELSFGSLPQEGDVFASLHPLQRIRSFFHFPEQELYLNLQVPPSRRPWTRFSIVLDLDAGWPREPVLTPDVFKLFVVPAINLRKARAEPIVADGTQDAYAIRYPDPAHEFRLCAVSGVYRATTHGLQPLRSGVLPGGDNTDSYEIEQRPPEWGASHWLLVRMPAAFTAPRTLCVEATWHQPWFDEQAVGKLKVTIIDRLLEGLEWGVLGPLRPHRDSVLSGEPFELLQLLAMKMKPTLKHEELQVLLGYLIPPSGSLYRGVLQKLQQLLYRQAPDSALRGSGIRHIYLAKLDSYSPDEEPLVWNLLMQIRELLDVWNQDATVELEADTSGSTLSVATK